MLKRRHLCHYQSLFYFTMNKHKDHNYTTNIYIIPLSVNQYIKFTFLYFHINLTMRIVYAYCYTDVSNKSGERQQKPSFRSGYPRSGMPLLEPLPRELSVRRPRPPRPKLAYLVSANLSLCATSS